MLAECLPRGSLSNCRIEAPPGGVKWKNRGTHGSHFRGRPLEIFVPAIG
jgi:hypothetical protein